MATCQDIVTRALQMARITALGRTPKAAESEHGLMALQSLYDSFFASGAFGTLTDVYTEVDYEAGEGERVIATTGVTVTLPDTIVDDNTGLDRTPRELSAVVVVQDGLTTNNVYEAAAWVSCTGLELGDDAPLSNRDAAGLAAVLAKDIAGTFGTELSGSQRQMADRFRMSLFYKLGSDQGRGVNQYY